MLDYIKGELVEITPASAVLEAGGLGYMLTISLNTYSAIQNQKQSKLYVHEAIREDAHQLFGFQNKLERQLFQLLISVSGIGGGTAILILSALSPRELSDVIASENVNILKSIKGIGAKTAQRIIVDLKDKVTNLEGLQSISGGGTGSVMGQMSQVHAEAQQALVMLGFAAPQTAKVVAAVIQEQPGATVEQVIKMALKRL